MDKDNSVTIKKSVFVAMVATIVVLVLLVLTLGFIALDRTIRVNELVGMELTTHPLA